MKYSRQIRSISYLKAHAAEVVRDLAERQEPLVITQNGEAKAVLSYTSTAPLKTANTAAVSVEGKWTP